MYLSYITASDKMWRKVYFKSGVKLPYYLLLAGEGENRSIHALPKAISEKREKQTASSRVLTLDAKFISYDDN